MVLVVGSTAVFKHLPLHGTIAFEGNAATNDEGEVVCSNVGIAVRRLMPSAQGYPRGPDADFQASRWFDRDWTLRELLAPASVDLFTKEGQLVGDKKNKFVETWLI
jgi:hypothetical protein